MKNCVIVWHQNQQKANRSRNKNQRKIQTRTGQETRQLLQLFSSISSTSFTDCWCWTNPLQLQLQLQLQPRRLGGINFCPVAEKMSRFHISYKGFRPRWAWELATGSRSPSQVRMCVFLLQEKVLSMVKINCQPCCSLTLCLAINWKADPLRNTQGKTLKWFYLIIQNMCVYIGYCSKENP